MKKLLLIALAAVMMAGCSTDGRRFETIKDGGDIKTIRIDSCEYIISHVYYGNVIIHKQDCRYCAERRKAEIREIVELLKDK